jgi:hypothetical protein
MTNKEEKLENHICVIHAKQGRTTPCAEDFHKIGSKDSFHYYMLKHDYGITLNDVGKHVCKPIYQKIQNMYLDIKPKANKKKKKNKDIHDKKQKRGRRTGAMLAQIVIEKRKRLSESVNNLLVAASTQQEEESNNDNVSMVSCEEPEGEETTNAPSTQESIRTTQNSDTLSSNLVQNSTSVPQVTSTIQASLPRVSMPDQVQEPALVQDRNYPQVSASPSTRVHMSDTCTDTVTEEEKKSDEPLFEFHLHQDLIPGLVEMLMNKRIRTKFISDKPTKMKDQRTRTTTVNTHCD